MSQFVIDWIGQFDVHLRERLIERYLRVPFPKRPVPPRPDPCLTCPPPDMLEAAVLGGVVRAAAEVLYADGGTVEATLKRPRRLDPEEMNKHLVKGAAAGLGELHAQHAHAMKQTEALFGSVDPILSGQRDS